MNLILHHVNDNVLLRRIDAEKGTVTLHVLGTTPEKMMAAVESAAEQFKNRRNH